MEAVPQQSKKCKGPCEQMRELSNFHGRGNASKCKICIKQAYNEKKAKNHSKTPEEIKDLQTKMYPTGLKHCSGCGEMHELSNFGVNMASSDLFTTCCKKCSALRDKASNNILKIRSYAEIFSTMAMYLGQIGMAIMMLTKECNVCHKTKGIGWFGFYTYEPSGVRNACIDCMSEMAKQTRLKQLEFISNLKEKGCQTCGIKDCRVLDLAHIDSSIKYKNKNGITVSPTSLSRRLLIKEAPNLKVLCAVHHRIETNLEFGNPDSEEHKKVLIRNEKIRRGECIDCGMKVIYTKEFDNTNAFDFDHIDKSTKVGNISKMNTPGEIITEFPKCVMRDANCHRIKTSLFDYNFGIASVKRVSVLDHYFNFVAGKQYINAKTDSETED
jgi:hypothetical protein